MKTKRRFWWPSLWRDIEYGETAIKHMCEDWASAHTHLQNLCRKAGCTELEADGDGLGVPDLEELADALFNKLSSDNNPAQTPEGQRPGIGCTNWFTLL